MRKVLAAGVLSLAVLAAVAPAAAQSDASEFEVDASQVCSEHHKFGVQPVDVAKTADGTIVLAQIAWNWHDSIGCYLTLDEGATAVLREALPPATLPSEKTAASQLCSQHHGFGVNPVDVAKAADGAAVLARLVWNWHDSIGCYLTLDTEALETLQVAHAAANVPDPTPDLSASPANISGWAYFTTENDDGDIQGYARRGTRPGSGTGSTPWLYVRCYGDSASPDIHIYSEDALSRDPGDESVAVFYRLPGRTNPLAERWWAHDEGGTAIFPHDSFIDEALAAGDGTLSVTFTGADGAARTYRFDMTGFDEVVETLSQMCSVPLAGAPNGDGDPIAGRLTVITVPASEPSGRCASAVSPGVYEWEQCAWAEYWEDSDYNYSLSDGQAATLIERIWAEVDVDGKPITPPTNSLIPAGSLCATATGGDFIIGCYQPSLHHIRRLDAFLETLLHETAHALVANHASIRPCRSLTDNDEYQACVHNDIFRCTANYLYMEYADIPDAGVCGTAPERQSTGFQPTRWTSSIEEGEHHAWVRADWHSRPSPYEDSRVSLVVRCLVDGTLDVYFWFDEGRIEGMNGRVPAVYIFLPEGFGEWGSERQQEYVAANRVDADWYESTTNMAAFLPERLHEDFLNDAVDYDAVLIRARDHDNSDFGLMAFSLEDAYRHIRPVTEECGWTWS